MNHTLLSPEQVARLRQAADAIQAFAEESDRAQHFDTGEALQLMGEAHDAIEWIFTPTKDRRATPREYAISIEYGSGNGYTSVARTFPTVAELTAFHTGMIEGAKIGEWEVTYTDEPTPEPAPEPEILFDVHIRLADQILAKDADEAFDKMMDMIAERQGFEIMGHDIMEPRT